MPFRTTMTRPKYQWPPTVQSWPVIYGRGANQVTLATTAPFAGTGDGSASVETIAFITTKIKRFANQLVGHWTAEEAFTEI